MFLDYECIGYLTDSEICNETEVSHRPNTVLEASQGDPDRESDDKCQQPI